MSVDGLLAEVRAMAAEVLSSYDDEVLAHEFALKVQRLVDHLDAEVAEMPGGLF